MRSARRTWLSLVTTAVLAMLMVAACRDSLPSSASAPGSRGADGAGMNVIAFSAEVCGVIPATLVITENTRLTCDVVCTNESGPCIQFGRDNITLFLDGYTMTGPASPPLACAPSPHCITYEGATVPRPCPSFPRSRGHY